MAGNNTFSNSQASSTGLNMGGLMTAGAGAEETIESCKIKIAWLAELVEEDRSHTEHSLNESDITQEISVYHNRMGDIFLARNDMNEAAACYETALQLNPRNLSARMNLLKTRTSTTREDVVKAFLTGMLVERPYEAALYNQLARLHVMLNETTAAIENFQKAIIINPDDTDSLYGLADMQQSIGEKEKAEKNYLRAMKLRPIIKSAASNQAAPDFSALVIVAPLLGNTPTSYIMSDTCYEKNILPLFSDTKFDLEQIRRSGQVVINTVSEADQSRAVLPLVTSIIDQLDMPVINHPAKVLKTTREEIARILQELPACRFGQVVRICAGEETTEEALQAKIPFSAPLLARPTGTHGGEKFEKIDSLAALGAFIAQSPDTDHYLIEYVEYQSPDNHFRKYRFIFVDDQIMPYHLAIGDHWKVHHNTTNMADHQWMKDEEKSFLENPATVFSPQNYETLRAIQQAVGLDYFGIDCGVDQAGNLVVFEVNASMMVHHHNEQFPYKNSFVQNIKDAFTSMLRKHAESYRKR